jgi:hypothetical protein
MGAIDCGKGIEDSVSLGLATMHENSLAGANPFTFNEIPLFSWQKELSWHATRIAHWR